VAIYIYNIDDIDVDIEINDSIISRQERRIEHEHKYEHDYKNIVR